ncbi:MAG TPA: hypothetical protein VEX86_14845 [Longimicrobium sp.]|nr:hypothetical protein [Longimicrobium sp.]
MRKLTLDPESLRVESFLTAASPAGRGTVRGAQIGVATVPELPIGVDTGCTAPCMSNQSECPIQSCGSDCDPDGVGFRV